MRVHERIAFLAKMSKQRWEQRAERQGPHITAMHDTLQKMLENDLRQQGIDPSHPSTILALNFAAHQARASLGDALPGRVPYWRLSGMAGLLAESWMDRGITAEFRQIVEQPTFVDYPEESEPAPPEVHLAGTYSCNSEGRVWPVTKKGAHRESDRQYLEGTDTQLDAIVARVLKVQPAGGRFICTGDQVVLAADLTPVP